MLAVIAAELEQLEGLGVRLMRIGPVAGDEVGIIEGVGHGVNGGWLRRCVDVDIYECVDVLVRKWSRLTGFREVMVIRRLDDCVKI
jgi:hypothetical protein